MGLLDGVRGLVWPASMPRAIVDAPKVRATWPTLGQTPPTLGGALPDGDFWGGPTWVPLVGEADILDHSLTYGDLYKQQVWVHTLVNKLSRGIGRLPLKIYTVDAAGERQRVRSGPLRDLLAQPVPRMTPSAFKQRIVGDMGVYGNSLWMKIAASSRAVPTSLEPLPAVGWRITGSGDYEFTSPRTGDHRTFDAWRVAHFRFWTPEEHGFAVSPIEPLRRALAAEDGAQRLAIAAFRNGGNMPGILTTPAKAADVAKDIARIRAEWQQRHGGADNAYKTPVLTDDLKWQATGATMKDAAVVEHRQITKEAVCAVYDVPPPVVGILDRATFSNITEQGRWLVQHTFNVWTTLIEETLIAQVLDGVPAFAGQFAEFDFAEILKGDLPARFTAYAQAINGGFLTQNEIRKLENYPPKTDDPDADRLHRPLSLSPAQAPPPPAPPAPNGAKEYAHGD